MYPTIEHPLYLRVFNDDGGNYNIPSLKNRKQPYIAKSKDGKQYVGIGKDATVREFEKRIGTLLQAQWEMSGFEPVSMPNRVIIYCRIVKYVAKPTSVPVSDLDNQYTTIQETLFNQIPAISDDRQVVSYYVEEAKTNLRNAQHAQVWIWVSAPDIPLFLQMAKFYLKHKPGEAKELEIKNYLPELLDLGDI